MTEPARSNAIHIHYEDGTVSYFAREPGSEDEWVLMIEGTHLTITGYDPPNVLRVLANSLGTREVAE